jgi:hypothetical protein
MNAFDSDLTLRTNTGVISLRFGCRFDEAWMKESVLLTVFRI